MRKRRGVLDDLDAFRRKLEAERYSTEDLQRIQANDLPEPTPPGPDTPTPEPEPDMLPVTTAVGPNAFDTMEPDYQAAVRKWTHLSEKEYAKLVRDTIIESVSPDDLRAFTMVLLHKALNGEYTWARLFLRMLTWLVPAPSINNLEAPKGVAIVIENYAADGRSERNTVVL